jgi:hypothetical protein
VKVEGREVWELLSVLVGWCVGDWWAVLPGVVVGSEKATKFGVGKRFFLEECPTVEPTTWFARGRWL